MIGCNGMRKPQFENGQFYHIYNRGVEKRQVFLDKKDYMRCIHDFFEFNDTASAGRFSVKRLSEVEPRKVQKRRKMLVKIHCFCLMPNHYHLLLEQTQDGGIVQFMKKFGTGYTMYFNKKYDRVGPLFQGRFRAVLLDDDSYLMHLSRYIHLNPVELVEPHWKKNGVKNWDKTNKFLESYRWSSYLDYIGRKNYPSVIDTRFIYELMASDRKSPTTLYKRFVKEWMAQDVNIVGDLLLE